MTNKERINSLLLAWHFQNKSIREMVDSLDEKGLITPDFPELSHNAKNTTMDPEEAQHWLQDIDNHPIPQHHISRALETIANMDIETITTEPHPRGSWNGDATDPYYFSSPPGTTMSRYITEWREH